MDSTGRIHPIPVSPETYRKMEAEFGKLVPIPRDELESVKSLSEADRVKWYLARAHNAAPEGLDADDARKVKNAAKRERKARRK